MRRVLLWSFAAACALVLVAAFAVLRQADDVAPAPPPDGSQPIGLLDGSTLPLAELLAKLERGAGAPVEPLAAGAGAAPTGILDDALKGSAARLYPFTGWGPVFKLAEHHRQAGRIDDALALFQSIRPGDPDYGRAQRRIAWSILTWERNEPEAALPYAQRALAAEPLDGNSWQDLARIYGRTLGLPLD